MGSFPETYNDLLALLRLAQARENLQKSTEMKFNAKVVVGRLCSLQCRRILGGRKLVHVRIATMKQPSLIL